MTSRALGLALLLAGCAAPPPDSTARLAAYVAAERDCARVHQPGLVLALAQPSPPNTDRSARIHAFLACIRTRTGP